MKNLLSRWRTVGSAALLACVVFASGVAFAQEASFCGLYRGVVTNALDPLLIRGAFRLRFPASIQPRSGRSHRCPSKSAL